MNNELNELIKCPFCKEQTVFASVLTIYEFLAEHRVKRSGVEFEGESIGELLGEMQHEPRIRVCSFRCSSCGEKWIDGRPFRLVKGDNELHWFVKQEEKVKRKGGKS